MPTEPAQIAIALFESVLFLSGVGLFIWLMTPSARQRWVAENRLPAWPLTIPEGVLLILTILFCGFVFQLGTQIAFGKLIAYAADRDGLGIMIYGVGFMGGCILGWRVFPQIRRRIYADYGSPVPLIASTPGGQPLSWAQVMRYGAATLAVALPIVSLTSAGWGYVLRRLGLPDDPQNLIEIFEKTQSPLVVLGMLLVAAVLAPISEELLFRAGIFRILRQRTTRFTALFATNLLFGAMHGNWSGFLPLAVFGAILAMAYEATGDLRVPIVAHALFNFNTVLIVLSGLPETMS